jgi:predicted CxxxxCH...CXXCH cytochrome family protein
MEGGDISDAFDCSDCHLVPSSLLDPGHIDPDSTAEMTWSDLAGAASSWNRSNATCSNVYCHGNFTGGLTSNSPVWTGTNQAGCGTCHDVGTDPGQLDWEHHAYHVSDAGLYCADCHASVTNTFLNIIGLPLHVNGQTDTLTRDPAICAACHGSGPEACTRCHGGIDNQSGAPPLGLRGETATSQLAVGAHTIADAFACSDCHLVPENFLDPGHIDPDSTAEMTWSDLAGAASSWNRSNATCSNVYCHGNFTGGSTSNSPVWTGANQANCGSCHDVGANPQDLSGRHEKHVVKENLDCNECHQTVVNQQLLIVGPQLHVNGLKNVSLLQGGTYQNGSCSGLNSANCHGSEQWF